MKWFLMKVDFDEKFFLMKMVLMNLYFTVQSAFKRELVFRQDQCFDKNAL